jgi:hypothetical protein
MMPAPVFPPYSTNPAPHSALAVSEHGIPGATWKNPAPHRVEIGPDIGWPHFTKSTGRAMHIVGEHAGR